MTSSITGLVAVLLAATGWGSNFVVTKQYDMHDGMFFQFWMCSGILFVGILTLFSSRQDSFGNVGEMDAVFSMLGLLGGLFWAIGNLCTVHIVRTIGLGLGLAIWAGTSLVVSFLLGRFSFFGLLDVKPLASLPLGILGCVLSVAALAVFSQVKPTLPDASKGGSLHEHSPDSISKKMGGYLHGGDSRQDLREALFADSKEGSTGGKAVFGISLAVLAGLVYGLQFFPFTLWEQLNPVPFGTSKLVHSTRFFFSQFAGIWLTSAVALVIHNIMNCGKVAPVPREAMVPSIISGMIWALGCIGSMFATSALTYSVGYPLTMNCSFLVNSSWSLLVFKEIKGRRQVALFGTAAVLNILSTILLTLAKPGNQP